MDKFLEILASDITNTIIVIFLPILITFVLGKLRTNKYIRKFVPESVEFADTLNVENKIKLIRAISDVENKILSKVPLWSRPLVDLLIDPKYIVTIIERYITERKRDDK